MTERILNSKVGCLFPVDRHRWTFSFSFRIKILGKRKWSNSRFFNIRSHRTYWTSCCCKNNSRWSICQRYENFQINFKLIKKRFFFSFLWFYIFFSSNCIMRLPGYNCKNLSKSPLRFDELCRWELHRDNGRNRGPTLPRLWTWWTNSLYSYFDSICYFVNTSFGNEYYKQYFCSIFGNNFTMDDNTRLEHY